MTCLNALKRNFRVGIGVRYKNAVKYCPLEKRSNTEGKPTRFSLHSEPTFLNRFFFSYNFPVRPCTLNIENNPVVCPGPIR